MKRAEEEAAYWVLRTPQDRQQSPEFARWIAQPGHRALFDQMSDMLDRLPDEQGLRDLPLPAARRISRRAMLTGGAGLAAVAVGGVGFALRDPGALQTGRSRQLTASLPQGEVLLDAGSHLSRAPGAPMALRSGRAEFRSTAPVVLAQPGCRLELRGRVSLHRAGPGSEVTVIEGSCAITPDQGADFALAAGEQALVVPGEMPRRRTSDLAEELAWTQGRAVFEDRPLWLVISDLNRYRLGHVQLLRGLEGRRVSGGYPISDPDQGLEGLVAGLSLTRRDITPWLVLLSA